MLIIYSAACLGTWHSTLPRAPRGWKPVNCILQQGLALVAAAGNSTCLKPQTVEGLAGGWGSACSDSALARGQLPASQWMVVVLPYPGSPHFPLYSSSSRRGWGPPVATDLWVLCTEFICWSPVFGNRTFKEVTKVGKAIGWRPYPTSLSPYKRRRRCRSSLCVSLSCLSAHTQRKCHLRTWGEGSCLKTTESSPETKLPTPFLFFFWLCWIFIAVHGLSLVIHWLSCPTAWGILVPQPQIKPVSSALEGGFLTTGLPGKSPDLQNLDLGLPASRTVRSKCCVRPPTYGHGCPRRLTHWMTSSPHIYASVLQSLFFPLYISAWELFIDTPSSLPALFWTTSSLLMSPSKALFISVLVFQLLVILIDSLSEFLSLCLPYPCIFACCPLFH